MNAARSQHVAQQLQLHSTGDPTEADLQREMKEEKEQQMNKNLSWMPQKEHYCICLKKKKNKNM